MIIAAFLIITAAFNDKIRALMADLDNGTLKAELVEKATRTVDDSC